MGSALAATLLGGCGISKEKRQNGGRYVTSDRLGVCSWSFQLPLDSVAEEMRKMGLRNINLALQPFLEGDERHGKAEDAGARARRGAHRIRRVAHNRDDDILQPRGLQYA